MTIEEQNINARLVVLVGSEGVGMAVEVIKRAAVNIGVAFNELACSLVGFAELDEYRQRRDREELERLAACIVDIKKYEFDEEIYLKKFANVNFFRTFEVLGRSNEQARRYVDYNRTKVKSLRNSIIKSSKSRRRTCLARRF